jgi:hypothetical protein
MTAYSSRRPPNPPHERQQGFKPLPEALLPQVRPTPTLHQALAVTAFLRSRLQPSNDITQIASRRAPEIPASLPTNPPESAAPQQDRPAPGTSHTALAARILAPGGLLERYQAAAQHASTAPHGLEQAWCLVAATLATVVEDLAAAWADHPDFPTAALP